MKNDAEIFAEKLENAIHRAMQSTVADEVKLAIMESVQENVYDKYEPTQYKRRGVNGGLADPNMMDQTYDVGAMTLEIRSSGKGAHGRKDVAEIVESGQGYTWKKSEIAQHPFPRPFHRPAEERLAQGNEIDNAIKSELLKAGFDVR